jgi:hypothetical protein
VSPEHSPLADLLAELGRVLGGLGVRWYLFGAQAAILHGAARLTADVDVTADLGERPAVDLVEALTAAGFDLRVGDPTGFVERTRVLPMVHRGTAIPVDVVLAGPGLEELFLSRAVERRLGDVRVPVLAAEDLVATKILAGRAKDLDDAASVVRAQGERLDVELIRTTVGLLERALSRADLLPELERVLERARRPRR